MKKMNYYLMMTTVLFFFGCTSGETDKAKEEESVETILPSKIAEVTVETITPKLFSTEIVSNGKVSAHEYADLSFGVSDNSVIDKIYVKNGDVVKKGQIIASLDRFKLENTLEQNKNELEKAKLELADVLIGQGYDPDNTSSVPAEIMKLARLRSGLDQAENTIAATKKDLEGTVLTAPFDGVVANMFSKVHNRPSSTEPFCRIISSGAMDVDFSVLESELSVLHNGDEVTVMPYSDLNGTHSGRITEINPLVDKDGLVQVRASVNGGNKLYDGMNVKVAVKRALDKQIVVPKSAVVLRTGKQVVFTEENGRAMWNYVQTGLENLSEIVITDGLTEGQRVITSGNINLAHEAPVRVK